MLIWEGEGGVNEGNFDEEYWRKGTNHKQSETPNKQKLDLEGGGEYNWKINETKKAQINSAGWQRKRVDNNRTNKAQASGFCSTSFHHSSVRKMENFKKQKKPIQLYIG